MAVSRQDILEMQQILRERAEEEYKRNVNIPVDEKRGVRYATLPPALPQ